MTKADLLRYYQEFYPVNMDGCVLRLPFWKYGSEHGTTVPDISGQHNDGAITGATPADILPAGIDSISNIELVTNGDMELGTADGPNLITNPGFETIGPELVTNGTMEAGTADASELVSNGEFETNTTGWDCPNGSVSLAVSSGGGHNGNALQITRISDWEQGRYTFASPLTPDKYYKVSVWYKSGTSGDEEVTFQITRLGTGVTTSFPTVTTSSTWTNMTGVFKADANSYELTYVKSYTANPGTWFIDSVSLKEAIPGPNLVTNGTMEAGTADGAELVGNGDMETWASATDAGTWSEVNDGTTTVNREGTNQYAGTYGARFDVDAGGNVGRLTQDITLDPSKYYRLVGYHRRDAGSLGVASIALFDSGFNVSLNAGSSWSAGFSDIAPTQSVTYVRFEIVFKPHASYTTYRLSPRASGANGSVYWDSISVKECFPPTGWLELNTPEAIDRSTVQKNAGSYSLHINDSTASYGGAYLLPTLVGGKTYLVSWSYYVVTGTAYGNIQDGGGAGNIGVGKAMTGASWQSYSEVVYNPTSGSGGSLYFWNNSGEVAAEFYIDDVQVQELQTSSGYTVDGWTTFNSPVLTDRSTVVAPHGGTYSIHAMGTDENYRGVSQAVSQTAGKTYRVSFWYYVVSGSAYSHLSTGTQITVALDYQMLSTTGAWTYTEKTYTQTASGSTGGVVFCTNGVGAEFFIDDVSVVEVLSGWIPIGTLTAFQVATATPTPHGGTYDVKVATDDMYEGIQSPSFVMTANHYYRLSGWIYGDGATQFRWNINGPVKGGWYNSIAGVVYPASWTYVETFIKATDTETAALFQIYNSAGGTGTYYLDDVSLQEVFAPTGWAIYNTPVLNRSTVQAHAGTYSAHVYADAANDGVQGATFALTSGHDYRICGWVYSDASLTVTLKLATPVATGSTTIGTAIAASWTFIDTTITAAATETAAYLYAYADKAGHFYCDDFSVMEVSGHQCLGIAFDGVDDVVTVAHDATLNLTTMTLALWVRMNKQNISNHLGLIRKEDSFDFRLQSGTAGRIWVTTDAVKDYDFSALLDFEEWVCLGFSLDDSWDGRLYINGVLSETITHNISPNLSNNDLVIGFYNQYMHGVIGDIIIFNRALSAQEIQSYYYNTRHIYGV